jgi:hypothetical protein
MTTVLQKIHVIIRQFEILNFGHCDLFEICDL